MGVINTTYRRIPGTDDNGTRRVALEERLKVHEEMAESGKTRRRRDRERGCIEGLEQAIRILETEVVD